MNYSDTIEKIRRLAQGEDVCDDALCKLLLDNITNPIHSLLFSLVSTATVE